MSGRKTPVAASSSSRAPDEPSVLRRATDATLAVAKARRALYRGVARAVAGSLVAGPLLAITVRLWLGAVALVLVPVFVAVYLAGDARILRQWRRLIVTLWCDSGLRVDRLEGMLRDSGALPDATLRAMFGALPEACRATPASMPEDQRLAIRRAAERGR